MSDPLIIKICGIKTEAILEAAIEAGADMVGFVHFARSPRHLELDPIGELISRARGRAETCVLLVNPDNTLEAQVAALGPAWIQLHGPEEDGRFGIFGGRYVAETLMPLIRDLETAYHAAKDDPAFIAEMADLRTHYAGRPSPLYYARRLTEHLGGAKVYLKREELNHSGSHKFY